MLANAISSHMCRINRRHTMTCQSIQTYCLPRRMHRLPRRLSLRCGHLLIAWLTYSSTRSSTRGRTYPRRRPLEWFLFVPLCYLYCIDFYGHIQKLVCTICGVLVVVDERYPTLFGFALDVTMYIACNAECAIYDVFDDYFDIYALLKSFGFLICDKTNKTEKKPFFAVCKDQSTRQRKYTRSAWKGLCRVQKPWHTAKVTSLPCALTSGTRQTLLLCHVSRVVAHGKGPLAISRRDLSFFCQVSRFAHGKAFAVCPTKKPTAKRPFVDA